MLTIRPAVPEDVELILAFIRELAEFERAPEKAMARPEDILRFFFQKPLAQAVIAEWNGEPAGWACWFYTFSTWDGRPGLYLEDLWVRLPFRGQGIGRGLLQRLASIALEEGCTRYGWQVLDWNTPALDFYDRMGAQVLREWLTCRVEGEALTRLAEGAP